ncbi:MAG: DNA repair protein Rad50 [Bacilli bacterium]|nr:DNA repair protein Rad50 [Bacilli bacterium]
MVVLKIKASGVYNFNNFSIDFSYPKKITGSTIENEHLAGFPNFRYKKAVILLGANATGKTCLGRLISNVVSYINTGNETFIKGMSKEEANIEICFVTSGESLYKIEIKLDERVSTILSECKIAKGDSFESAESKLKIALVDDVKAISLKVGILNTLFTYPEISEKLNIKDEDKPLFLKALRCVIGTLDPSLKEIVVSKEIDNSFIIKRGNDNIIIQEGKLLNKELLSSGTKEGIDVAHFIASLMGKERRFYYCDEHFSYIHSDVEKRIFSIMVGKLKDNEQLIFTTHNLDMLELNVPKHAFAFLKRREGNASEVVFADSILKRNTDSVRSAAENDLFDASPDLTLLDELEEERE